MKTKKNRTMVEGALVVDLHGACTALNTSRDKIYMLIRGGMLESYVEGRSRRITIASIKRYIETKIAGDKLFLRTPFAENNRSPP
jgi:excisionase family DNA binding protein